MTATSSGWCSPSFPRNGAGSTSRSPATRRRTAGCPSVTSAGTPRTRWTSWSRAATRARTRCTGRSGNSKSSRTPMWPRWTSCSSTRKPNCLRSDLPADIPGEPAQPEKRERRTGRNLPVAITVGLVLGGLAILTLFTVKATFLALVGVMVAIALWELTRAVAERQVSLPVIPVAVGGAVAFVLSYLQGERGALASIAITVPAILAWRLRGGTDGYLRDVTAGAFALAYLPLPACFVGLMLAPSDGPKR